MGGSSDVAASTESINRRIITALAVGAAVSTATLIGKAFFRDVYWEIVTPTPHGNRHIHIIKVMNNSMVDVDTLTMDFLVVAPNGNVHISGSKTKIAGGQPLDVFIWADNFVNLEWKDRQAGINRVFAKPENGLAAGSTFWVVVIGQTQDTGHVARDSINVTRAGGREVPNKSSRGILQRLSGFFVLCVTVNLFLVIGLLLVGNWYISRLKSTIEDQKREVEAHVQADRLPKIVADILQQWADRQRPHTVTGNHGSAEDTEVSGGG